MKRAQEKVKRLVEQKKIENEEQLSGNISRSLTPDGRYLSKINEDISESETESDNENTHSSMNTQNAVIVSSSAESVGRMKGLVTQPRDPRNPKLYSRSQSSSSSSDDEDESLASTPINGKKHSKRF